MEATIGNIIGVLTLMGIYIGLKVWIYSKEYKDESKKDI
jgi:cbb3-type cytochrome oxidase subunit 3